MPIASGASGRVNVGVDSSKRWTPDGLRGQPIFHQYDSYLQQYQELKQLQNQTQALQITKARAELDDHKDDGAKKEKSQRNGGSKSHCAEPASGGKSSKLCVVL